jgi:hypothetical protein
MTTIEITLPDALAREAAQAGLLTPETIERMLRDRLRADRVDRLQTARATLAADPLPAMTPQEIAAEIEAFRSTLHRAPGS